MRESLAMARRIREFIEIKDLLSLDVLIETLIEVRDNLPQDART